MVRQCLHLFTAKGEKLEITMSLFCHLIFTITLLLSILSCFVTLVRIAPTRFYVNIDKLITLVFLIAT